MQPQPEPVVLPWIGPLATLRMTIGEREVAPWAVVRVQLPGELQLFHKADVLDALGSDLGRGQGRQQQAGQNGDDRDHHQQFDEGEPAAPPSRPAPWTFTPFRRSTST